jgi:predicted small metal-binding protein
MPYEFACADAGFHDCEFEIRDESRDELIEFVQEHGRTVHNMEVSETDVENAMRTV